MYGFAHGVMAGVIITFVLAVFTLIWIYIEQCQPPKKCKAAQVPDTKEEEFSSFMVVLLMGAMFTILLLIGVYFAVAY